MLTEIFVYKEITAIIHKCLSSIGLKAETEAFIMAAQKLPGKHNKKKWYRPNVWIM